MGQIIQDAPLSQRDRAASSVIVFAKSRSLELGDNTDIIGLSSTTVI